MHLRRRAGLSAVSAVLLVTLLTQQGAYAATINAEPDTGLSDGQTVTVSTQGTQFAVGSVMIQQCAAGPEAREFIRRCDEGSAVFVPTDQQGGITAQFTVSATIDTPFNGPVDCRTSQCLIEISQSIGQSTRTFHTAVLRFLPPPTAATPTTKAHCTDHGWRGLVTNAGLPFRNLGDCVSFVGPRSGANPTG
jgi:Neocarzinostatin family